MTLIKSISGIRGTIGGKVTNNLTPIDTVQFAAAYGIWLKNRHKNKKHLKIIIGRDARISGAMVSNLVSNTLIGLGINVVDAGLSTTPTVEVAVLFENADGGIVITASHNPKEWNALKLLNEKGEFLNAKDGEELLRIADSADFNFALIDDLGNFERKEDLIDRHIEEILALEIMNVEAIKKRKFKIVVDGVNSSGGIAVPALLAKLNVETIKLYCEPTGEFPHNPEPLPQHLTAISERVVSERADLGIAVDPDVDRLALIDENGGTFGEEYTLVACADYVLSKKPGNTVSNLSSSRALRDVTKKHGGCYVTSAVGEVNVVEKMKETSAVIGGEGNGGVIFPDSHYGRDALVGIALFLSHLTTSGLSCKELRATYPNYYMSKKKISLNSHLNPNSVLEKIRKKYKNEESNTIDGVKIDFEKEWVHLRKSNTEPIIRIYTESDSQENADKLAERFIREILENMG